MPTEDICTIAPWRPPSCFLEGFDFSSHLRLWKLALYDLASLLTPISFQKHQQQLHTFILHQQSCWPSIAALIKSQNTWVFTLIHWPAQMGLKGKEARFHLSVENKNSICLRSAWIWVQKRYLLRFMNINKQVTLLQK